MLALGVLKLKKDFQIKKRLKNGKKSNLMPIREGRRQTDLSMATLTTINIESEKVWRSSQGRRFVK